MYRIGIDLGGTNTAAGLVDEKGHIVDRDNVKTNLPTTPEQIVANITLLCRNLMARNGLTKENIANIGVGVPCTANKKTGCMEDADHLGFSSGQLAAPRGESLGLPVYIENDANAAAWGEYKAGGYDADSFVLVTLGTGIGGGLIFGGKLHTGINHTAGELGHMSIRMDGVACECGRTGCWERYGSATALIQQASQALGEEIAEAKTVFDRAASGDPVCSCVLDTYMTYLAEGFANIINVLSPAYICIGGGVSHAGDKLLRQVKEKTWQRTFAKNAEKNTQIILAKLHNDAGILGAALLEN